MPDSGLGHDLTQGFLARHGLLDDEAIRVAQDMLTRIQAEKIETVRIGFVDQHGIIRGKTLTAQAVPSALKSGVAVPSTLLLKDTSHKTVFPVWKRDLGLKGMGPGRLSGVSDMLMVPDPATFRVLPWSPHSGWMLADLIEPDGTRIAFSSRSLLNHSLDRLAARDLALTVGLEIEFHVFRITHERLDHGDAGMPGHGPETALLAQGYQLLTETTYDALEPVMDDLRRNAEALGLPVRSMEAEFGPSQFEFTFDPDGARAHADNAVLFRSMVKQVCRRRGLHATFMTRPRLEHAAASGWHVHQSLSDPKTGRNLFMPEESGGLTREASGWIAGLLTHAAESCLMTTPTVNGYKRYQPFQLAPDRIQWGVDNKGAMIRGLMKPGDPASRVENRVAEPAANPYLLFASQIESGLAGIGQGLEAPAPVDTPYDSDSEALPRSLISAIDAFEAGEMVRAAFGSTFVAYLSTLKRAEWERYLMTVSEWEQREYFDAF